MKRNTHALRLLMLERHAVEHSLIIHVYPVEQLTASNAAVGQLDACCSMRETFELEAVTQKQCCVRGLRSHLSRRIAKSATRALCGLPPFAQLCATSATAGRIGQKVKGTMLPHCFLQSLVQSRLQNNLTSPLFVLLGQTVQLCSSTVSPRTLRVTSARITIP